MYLIGIAGGSGSGKSTFAEKIVAAASSSDVIHINQDWYYHSSLPEEHFVKGQPNFDHPSAFDWDLLERHLALLKGGGSVLAPVYDYHQNNRSEKTRPIGPCKVAVLEGIYALWSENVRNLLDLRVFLDVDADIRFIRRLHRDVRERGRTLDSVINQYYDTVRPMHRQFLQPTNQFADLLVGEETDIAANVISEKIKALLRR